MHVGVVDRDHPAVCNLMFYSHGEIRNPRIAERGICIIYRWAADDALRAHVRDSKRNTGRVDIRDTTFRAATELRRAKQSLCSRTAKAREEDGRGLSIVKAPGCANGCRV